jgi:hypothetical protein
MDGPLDDTVPAERAITVRDLLTFTFGFGVSVEMFMATSPWLISEAGLHAPPLAGSRREPTSWS